MNLASTLPVQPLPVRIEQWGAALTANELSELLGIPRSSIYAMAKRGSIPHYLFGSTVRFDPAETAAWLRSRTVGKTKRAA